MDENDVHDHDFNFAGIDFNFTAIEPKTIFFYNISTFCFTIFQLSNNLRVNSINGFILHLYNR